MAGPVSDSCGKAHAASTSMVPLSTTGSSVALFRVGKSLFALASNKAGKRIDVVDVQGSKWIGSVSLAGSPEALLMLPDGRVLASLIDGGAVQTVQAGEIPLGTATDKASPSSKKACLERVPNGPASLALSEDGSAVALASTYAGSVSLLDSAQIKLVKTIPVGRSPRAVLFQGSSVYVTRLAGEALIRVDFSSLAAVQSEDGDLVAIDLGLLPATQSAAQADLRRKRQSAQAYSLVGMVLTSPKRSTEKGPQIGGRIIVPHVSVDPGDIGRVSPTYYGPPPIQGIAKEVPFAATIDVGTNHQRATHLLALAPDSPIGECLLPRAAALRTSNSRLYVACRGIDQVLELDATAADPMRSVLDHFDLRSSRKDTVTGGPTGIAVADEEGLAVVFNEFGSSLSVISLAGHGLRSISLEAGIEAMASSYEEGRQLFYRTNDSRLSSDGVACSSCHPDGGDDSFTWITPEGPRQTPMLAGRVHGTAPYGWTRGKATLPEYVADTITRLGGTGVQGTELIAISSFLERMPAPPPPPRDKETLARGQQIFRSSGCETCHIGVVGTDASNHAVTATAVDTPSLRFVGMTAPYFHDGRYRSLRELVSDPESGMSRASTLPEADRRDLAEFLESL